MSKITVLNKEIVFYTKNEDDYISLTDIAKYKNAEATGLVISHWMSTKYTIEFMGLWEKINNKDFNPIEFDGIRKKSGLNSFILTAKQWIEKTKRIV